MLHFNYDETNVTDMVQTPTDTYLHVSNTIPKIFVGTKIVLNKSAEKNRTPYAQYTFSANLAFSELEKKC
jgi:hypothetical protein